VRGLRGFIRRVYSLNSERISEREAHFIYIFIFERRAIPSRSRSRMNASTNAPVQTEVARGGRRAQSRAYVYTISRDPWVEIVRTMTHVVLTFPNNTRPISLKQKPINSRRPI
jgi:hypothetical protein